MEVTHSRLVGRCLGLVGETELRYMIQWDTYNRVKKIRNMVDVSPGGMYWQDPVALTSTFVWNVASNLSSALQGEKSVNI